MSSIKIKNFLSEGHQKEIEKERNRVAEDVYKLQIWQKSCIKNIKKTQKLIWRKNSKNGGNILIDTSLKKISGFKIITWKHVQHL